MENKKTKATLSDLIKLTQSPQEEVLSKARLRALYSDRSIDLKMLPKNKEISPGKKKKQMSKMVEAFAKDVWLHNLRADLDAKIISIVGEEYFLNVQPPLRKDIHRCRQPERWKDVFEVAKNLFKEKKYNIKNLATAVFNALKKEGRPYKIPTENMIRFVIRPLFSEGDMRGGDQKTKKRRGKAK